MLFFPGRQERLFASQLPGHFVRVFLIDLIPVFTIPKMLRIFFKYKRRLLGDLCRLALPFLTRYFEVVAGSALTPGVIAVIQPAESKKKLLSLKKDAMPPR